MEVEYNVETSALQNVCTIFHTPFRQVVTIFVLACLAVAYRTRCLWAVYVFNLCCKCLEMFLYAKVTVTATGLRRELASCLDSGVLGSSPARDRRCISSMFVCGGSSWDFSIVQNGTVQV